MWRWMRQGQPPRAAGHRRRVIVYSSPFICVYVWKLNIFRLLLGIAPCQLVFSRMRGGEPHQEFVEVATAMFSLYARG